LKALDKIKFEVGIDKEKLELINIDMRSPNIKSKINEK